MNFRMIALMASVTVALMSVGCNDTTNENSANTANANRMANSNIANDNHNMNATANANTNTDTRRAPTREEYERDKDRYQREAKESGRTVGTGLNDGWLWVKTRYELATADDLRDSTINVDVDNGVVTLTGTVASAAQKTKADQVVKSLEGVKAVKNLLKVVPNTNSNAANKNSNSNRK